MIIPVLAAVSHATYESQCNQLTTSRAPCLIERTRGPFGESEEADLGERVLHRNGQLNPVQVEG